MTPCVDVQLCYHGAECSAWDCFSPIPAIMNDHPALLAVRACRGARLAQGASPIREDKLASTM